MNEARRCEHCNVPLVELDAYGKRLRGCLGCNRWQVVNGVSYQRTTLLRWGEWALIGVGGGGETMPAFDPKFSVRVAGNDILVTLQGTSYAVTYFKRRGSPGLFAKDIVHKDDPRIPMTSAEFLAGAWNLANEKARELGWIV